MKKILCKTYCFIFLSFMLCSLGNVQAANVYKQARENIKANKKLPETINTLLEEAAKAETSPKNRVECYTLAAECSGKIHDAENMKLYLKQPYDTVKFFSTIADKIHYIYLADSVERVPDANGKLLPSHAKDYRSQILANLNNLHNGGLWSYKRKKKADAYRYFNLYIDMAKHPLFANTAEIQNDLQRANSAYMAVNCAYGTNPYGVIKHSELAQQSTYKNSIIQVYAAKSHLQLNDTLSWLKALEVGLQRYPQTYYFFNNLIDYKAEHQAYHEGLALADSMLAINDTVPLYWYAKSLMLLKLNNNREAINACDSCLHYAPYHVDASYNKGIASMNLALEYEKQACTDITNPKCKRDREIVKSLYALARKPMEFVRKAQPKQPQRWAPALYRIYLHLNLGKEFDEMDKLLQQLNITAQE